MADACRYAVCPDCDCFRKNKLVILNVTVYCNILVFGNFCNGVLLLGVLFWFFGGNTAEIFASVVT